MSNLVPIYFDIWGLGLELVFSTLFSMMSVQQMIEATNNLNLQTTKSPLMTHLDENVSKACHDQGKLISKLSYEYIHVNSLFLTLNKKLIN